MRDPVRRLVLPVLLVAALAVVAWGVLNGSGSPVDRANALEERLRCPTCQSVSIADSPSETASAMREEVEQQVAAGRTDQEVFDYFRARYGDWVVLEPPASGVTLLLWLLPVAAVGVGLAVLATLPRRHVPALPEEERERVRRELDRVRPAVAEEDEP
ncbi:cytochrome C biosynthesis protein [Actinotalea ferrariae CF5-4]|uniref:Cytochrome c-type biogenesis protein n=1 Tax=Actinotalea ferrariae CF5-4 TaxID=948458 RepID=A0A021VTK8_9CELL|nr:cytochrome c-type biogenesis protein [Actinotalea ferrariae]EYR64496.1 cytochrome C biosynthesis protein [Actinotalea ferrariae CF5-4]